jgi:hypothetical protein
MALDDIPLEDAGRDYYARQFDSRVRNIRKYGSAPPARNSGGRANGWVAGAGVVAVLIAIRMIMAVVIAGSHSSSAEYNDYQAPPTFENQSKPWEVAPIEPANVQPDDPQLGPAMRRLLGREPLPPVAPDDENKRPDKDD